MWVAVLCFVILLTGVVFVSSANIVLVEEHEIENPLSSPIFDVKNITAKLERGMIVKLRITPQKEWVEFVELLPPDYIEEGKTVWIDLIDPNGRFTRFELVLIKTGTPFSPMALYSVTVVPGYENASFQILDLKELKGRVLAEGNYTLSFWGAMPPGGGPPHLMEFLKIEVSNEQVYPYRFLLIPGIVLIILAIAVPVASYLRREKRRKISTRPRIKKGEVKFRLYPFS